MKKKKQISLLLTEDVAGTGRKGEVVGVAPGFARNYILPKHKGFLPTKRVLRLQEQLREERAAQAKVDREEASQLAQTLSGITKTLIVKVDQLGHMYGSVSATDIAKALVEDGFNIERRDVILPRPIKKVGEHVIDLNLKEGVKAHVKFVVSGEEEVAKAIEGIAEEIVVVEEEVAEPAAEPKAVEE